MSLLTVEMENWCHIVALSHCSFEPIVNLVQVSVPPSTAQMQLTHYKESNRGVLLFFCPTQIFRQGSLKTVCERYIFYILDVHLK